MPETDDDLDVWLKKLWADKEERLRKFYTTLDPAKRLDILPGTRIFEVNFYFEKNVFTIIILSHLVDSFYEIHANCGYWNLALCDPKLGLLFPHPRISGFCGT